MMTTDESESFGKIAAQLRTLTGYATMQKHSKGFSFEEKYVFSGNDTKGYLVRITGPGVQGSTGLKKR